MTDKTPIPRDRVLGASRASSSRIVGGDGWFTQFNMRIKKTGLEQVPRKRILLQVGVDEIVCEPPEPPPEPPVLDAFFDLEANSFNAPSHVFTTDLSTISEGAILTWDWNWGDGSAHSSTQDSSHIYNTPGTYTITLTVTGDGDTVDSYSAQITINSPPIDLSGVTWGITILGGAGTAHAAAAGASGTFTCGVIGTTIYFMPTITNPTAGDITLRYTILLTWDAHTLFGKTGIFGVSRTDPNNLSSILTVYDLTDAQIVSGGSNFQVTFDIILPPGVNTTRAWMLINEGFFPGVSTNNLRGSFSISIV